MSGKKIFAIVLAAFFVASIIVLISQPKTTDGNPGVGGIMLMGYFFITGVIFFRHARNLIIGWYKKQGWIFTGTSALNVASKQLNSRISMELLSVGAAFFAGGLGGAYYVLLKNDKIE